jgi:hypothetical protein
VHESDENELLEQSEAIASLTPTAASPSPNPAAPGDTCHPDANCCVDGRYGHADERELPEARLVQHGRT